MVKIKPEHTSEAVSALIDYFLKNNSEFHLKFPLKEEWFFWDEQNASISKTIHACPITSYKHFKEVVSDTIRMGYDSNINCDLDYMKAYAKEFKLTMIEPTDSRPFYRLHVKINFVLQSKEMKKSVSWIPKQ